MITCLGLDISTKTGVTVVREDGGVIYHNEIKYPKGLRDLPRAVHITNSIMEIYHKFKPTIVCTEGYALHAKFNLATMVELGTVVRLALQLEGVEYYEVAPTALKKFLTGKGNVKKQVMLLECFKRLDFETTNDNIADAAALSFVGLAMKGHNPKSLPKVNLEALEKVAVVTPNLFCT